MNNSIDKNKQNNSRIYLTTIILVLLISLLIGIIFLIRDNEMLSIEVEQRDTLISNIKRSNIDYELSLKKYADIIAQYTDGCDYKIDGKTISNTEIVNEYIKQIDVNNAMVSEIQRYNDSLSTYKSAYFKIILDKNKMIKLINELGKQSNDFHRKLEIQEAINKLNKEKYGIDIKAEINDSTNTITLSDANTTLSKVDSALLIFKYYNRVLEYDSLKKVWITHLVPLDDYLPSKKKRLKFNK
jgi:hypothetical protein